MKLTTTFNKLKLARACGQTISCDQGYDKLSQYLKGADAYGKDEEINILTILDSNGLDDALWCLRATVQEADNVKRLIAADFAESVLHIFESKYPGDDRPRKAIQAARDFAAGNIDKEQLKEAKRSAAYAASAAAASADAAAAYAAAYAAASAAAASAAYAAAYAAYAAYAYAYAAYAAYADAYAARKTKKEQLAQILRKHLED